jgi:hypothetical protein
MLTMLVVSVACCVLCMYASAQASAQSKSELTARLKQLFLRNVSAMNLEAVDIFNAAATTGVVPATTTKTTTTTTLSSTDTSRASK